MLFVEGEVLDLTVRQSDQGRDYHRAVLTNGMATVSVDVSEDLFADLTPGQRVRWPVVQRVIVPKSGGNPFVTLRALGSSSA